MTDLAKATVAAGLAPDLPLARPCAGLAPDLPAARAAAALVDPDTLWSRPAWVFDIGRGWAALPVTVTAPTPTGRASDARIL